MAGQEQRVRGTEHPPGEGAGEAEKEKLGKMTREGSGRYRLGKRAQASR